MSRLRDAIRARAGFSELPLPLAPSAIEQAVKQVRQILGATAIKEPTAYDLKATYRLVSALPVSLNNFFELGNVHFKRVPWVLFESPEGGLPPLVERNGLLSGYLRAVAKRGHPAPVVTLVEVFLRVYPHQQPYFDVLRKHLSLLVSHLNSARGRALAERASQHGFFEIAGAKDFGTRLAGVDDPKDLLVEAGFDPENAQHGFIMAAMTAALGVLGQRLAADRVPKRRLTRFLDFLRLDSEKPNLRFPSHRVATVDALLLPFMNRQPQPDIQETVRDFLVEVFGDPRVSQANWHAVDIEVRNVLMRWLVGSTLADFFRVVREGSQQDRNADRMWPYREAFWSAYLKKGVISDAWVVLGEQMAYRSREFLASQADAYARFNRGTGVSPHHAALIMRIGNLIITEWNFSGKYRVWQTDKLSAPSFYRKRYTRGELIRNPDFEKSHHGAEAGSWQETLALYIADWTGVRITRQEYMPR